jgi:hypothetical protein
LCCEAYICYDYRMEIRHLAQRKQDTLDKLRTERDVWVATADGDAQAHLVPVALCWDGTHVVVATETRSITARNVAASHQARLALGDTRDVVMIDVTVASTSADSISAEIGDMFAARHGWDPRTEDTEWVYLTMTPVRIQAWRNVDEIKGRTLMRGGEWLQ